MLLPPADLTGHPPLHLDDVRRAGEAEAPQNSLPALELVHLQDGAGLLQLPLGCPDLGGDLNNREIIGINHPRKCVWGVFLSRRHHLPFQEQLLLQVAGSGPLGPRPALQ